MTFIVKLSINSNFLIFPKMLQDQIGKLEIFKSSDFLYILSQAPSVHDILIYKWNNRAWARGRVEKVQKKDKLIMRDVSCTNYILSV